MGKTDPGGPVCLLCLGAISWWATATPPPFYDFNLSFKWVLDLTAFQTGELSSN